MSKRWGGRRLAVTGALAAVGALTTAGLAASPSVADARREPPPPPTGATVVVNGLDNPRQMHLRAGDVFVAEAGHGSNDPDDCSHDICIGLTGKIGRLRHGDYTHRLNRLVSGAEPDGSFATGADGVAVRDNKHGNTLLEPVMTYGRVPEGTPGRRQFGMLLVNRPVGDKSVLADISAFERRRDPDGEGVESNPYAGLGLKNKTLVADAAGDYIAAVRPGGKVRLWATMPEYGRRVDAVPTVVSRGVDNTVLVGELHSEEPGAAKVLVFDRAGNRVGTYRGFTTVTGVAQAPDGTLYVSELFGGDCRFADIPSCLPGRVVKVETDGDREHIDVPFPAGIVAGRSRVLVAAYSTAPKAGIFGLGPDSSGAIWSLDFDAVVTR